MPMAPKRPCAQPGCAQLVDGYFCERHSRAARQRDDNRRGSSASRGYGHRWQKARKGFLTKHPLCVHCQGKGRTTEANTVDHIVPHRGDKKLFWDRSNWQALCETCHNSKTATEDGGFGN